MEELLQDWELLEELGEIFRENEITIENLCDLNEELIKELIPQIGRRIKFTKKLEEYKSRLGVIENATIVLNLNEVINPLPDNLVGELAELNSASTSETSEAEVVPKFNNNVAFCGLDDFLSHNQIPDLDLKTLLQVVPYGSSILKYYKENNCLNEYMRNKLVDIIIRNMYQYIMK